MIWHGLAFGLVSAKQRVFDIWFIAGFGLSDESMIMKSRLICRIFTSFKRSYQCNQSEELQ